MSLSAAVVDVVAVVAVVGGERDVHSALSSWWVCLECDSSEKLTRI